MLIKKIYFCTGGLAERSIAAVLKTVEVSQPPGVRIPNPPLHSRNLIMRWFRDFLFLRINHFRTLIFIE
jgi:hypothetical protein